MMKKLDSQELAGLSEWDQPSRLSSSVGNSGSTRKTRRRSGQPELSYTRSMVQTVVLAGWRAPWMTTHHPRERHKATCIPVGSAGDPDDL